MKVQRGDVVLLNAPFVTKSGGKIRPMLVIQNDLNNERMDNTILVTISTNMRRKQEPTQVLIDVDTPDGKQTGLLARSVVSCENCITVQQSQVLKKIGALPISIQTQVDEALKFSLHL